MYVKPAEKETGEWISAGITTDELGVIFRHQVGAERARRVVCRILVLCLNIYIYT